MTAEGTPFRGKRVLGEDGVWRNGSAAPELLREDLRKLPGELVTKDDADEERVHELDEEHIVDALTYEYGKKARAEENPAPPSQNEALPALSKAKPGVRVPLSQFEIDLVRFRVGCTLASEMAIDVQWNRPCDPEALWHLWFPRNDVNAYELRKGKEPPNYKRPGHLKNFRLTIDIWDPPQSIVDVLESRGVTLTNWKEMFEQAEKNRAAFLAEENEPKHPRIH